MGILYALISGDNILVHRNLIKPSFSPYKPSSQGERGGFKTESTVEMNGTKMVIGTLTKNVQYIYSSIPKFFF